MTTQRSFIQQCLDGDCGLDDMDDFIDAWHEGGTGLALWQFLGMDREQYALWVEESDVLPAILYAHRFQKPMVESVHDLAIAARGADGDDMPRIEAWLRRREAQPS